MPTLWVEESVKDEIEIYMPVPSFFKEGTWHCSQLEVTIH